jgi:dipeptidase E
MRLYLSSYQIGDRPERLEALLGPNKSAAIIQNAADAFGDESREDYLAGYAGDLAEMGISAEELDLRRHFGKQERLKTELCKYGLVWAVGGNTFVLRRAMHLSGMDLLLPDLLRNTDLVYGGFSAGACVLAPSLRGIHLVDQPGEIPSDYPTSGIIWNGLGLIDFHIVPHYRSPHPESAAMERVVAYYERHGMSYRTLRDGEAIVVDTARGGSTPGR